MAKPRSCRRLLAAVLLSLALAPVTGSAGRVSRDGRSDWSCPSRPAASPTWWRASLAERLSAELGQQVLVDNKTGAGGVIAGDIVAKAPADGYTLLLTTPNHTINAAFRATMPYDTEKDLRGGVERRPGADAAGDASVAAGHELPGLHRLRPQEPRQDQRLLGRQRHAAAHHDGTADAQGEVPGDQRALSRRRAGARRPGGGPGAGQARQLHAVGAVHRRPQAERCSPSPAPGA